MQTYTLPKLVHKEDYPLLAGVAFLLLILVLIALVPNSSGGNFSFAGLSFPQNKSKIMAWFYPTTKVCTAPQEYRVFQGITFLKPEYFSVSGTGSLTLLTEAKYGCGGYTPANAADVKAHSQYQFATVSADATSMRVMLENPTQRAESIAALTSFVRTTGFTGVELDFEGYGQWSPALYSEYKGYVQELGTKLHAQNGQLMVDLPPIGTTLEQSYYPLTYADMAKLSADYLVVMAYDYQYDYGAGTPIAPRTWLTAVVKQAQRSIPASKLVIGIPSYGYLGTTGSYVITKSTFADLAKEAGFATAVRDPSSNERTWRQAGTSYTYVDTSTLDAEKKVIDSLGVRYVSVWSLGGNAWFGPEETSM